MKKAIYSTLPLLFFSIILISLYKWKFSSRHQQTLKQLESRGTSSGKHGADITGSDAVDSNRMDRSKYSEESRSPDLLKCISCDSFKATTQRCTLKFVDAGVHILSNEKEDQIWVKEDQVVCYTACGYSITLTKKQLLRVRKVLDIPRLSKENKQDSVRLNCNDTLIQVYTAIDTFLTS